MNRSSSNSIYAEELQEEIVNLRRELTLEQERHMKKMEELRTDEQNIKNENLRLQRKLQVEIDRRKEFYQRLSESESSIEMDEERVWNQKLKNVLVNSN